MDGQMRKIAWLLLLLLVATGLAEAGQPETAQLRRKWDAAITIAAAEVRPGQNDARSYDNWFFQGRYAVQLGGYWTEHVKTELEYAKFGEGAILFQDYARLPGSPYTFPYTLESRHQLDQLQLRMTYQFGHNAWVHPYVSAGMFGTRDHWDYHTDVRYIPAGAVTITDGHQSSGRRNEFDFGFAAAAGAKIYIARHGFVNAGFNWTRGSQQTFTMFGGIGIDF
jgi:opacity protein-like surface antigen